MLRQEFDAGSGLPWPNKFPFFSQMAGTESKSATPCLAWHLPRVMVTLPNSAWDKLLLCVQEGWCSHPTVLGLVVISPRFWVSQWDTLKGNLKTQRMVNEEMRYQQVSLLFGTKRNRGWVQARLPLHPPQKRVMRANSPVFQMKRKIQALLTPNIFP